MNYYNEKDPCAAEWLRHLIYAKCIPEGKVDDRPVQDVKASDLSGFDQHHFFAGIGGWPLALHRAGWTGAVCTASLPCQPFSVAGTQKGKTDERHLLPHFLALVRQCRFGTIFGEQVESAIKFNWLDDLQTAMEAENYTVGHCVLGAHSAGAPHPRQRLFWVATKSGMGHPFHTRRNVSQEPGGNAPSVPHREEGKKCALDPTRTDTFSKVSWEHYPDGKRRAIKPGIPPVVNGFPLRVGYGSDPGLADNINATAEARQMRIKGYGNAIQVDTAALFISAFMEEQNEQQD